MWLGGENVAKKLKGMQKSNFCLLWSASRSDLLLECPSISSQNLCSVYEKNSMFHSSWKTTKSTFSSSSQSLWTLSMGCVWSEWKIKKQDLWFRCSTFCRCTRNHNNLKPFRSVAIPHKVTLYAYLVYTYQRPSLSLQMTTNPIFKNSTLFSICYMENITGCFLRKAENIQESSQERRFFCKQKGPISSGPYI